eukprot:4365815-Pyramimonas_sp.AAC.1
MEAGKRSPVLSGKKPAPCHGRLRDKHGDLVDADQKAETVAYYFEDVQWKLHDGPETIPE